MMPSPFPYVYNCCYWEKNYVRSFKRETKGGLETGGGRGGLD